jgi:bifunctional DNA-binding transcriptional regulator/antitoxin component of YhaV-PrlF toxin-antitoxin module
VDPSVDVPYGPHPLQKIGTVTVPKELQRAIGIEAGEQLHWFLSREIPGTLLLVPSVHLARVTEEIYRALREKA